MIGLVALFLPLFLGIGLAFPIGYRAERAAHGAKRRGKHWLPTFLKYVAGTGSLVLFVSIILAVMFADLADTLDGESSPEQFMGYIKFQAICMSVFLAPAVTMGLLLGRQRDEL